MIVKTNDVKERGNSIGMFSRNGKATALIHSMFRDEKVIKTTKKKIEDEYLAQMLANKTENKKKKEVEPVRSSSVPKESYFFRSLSREKAQKTRDRTPDAGIYKPRFTAVEPKTVFMGTLQRPVSHSVSFSQEAAPCLSGGVTCEFQIRNLKKKIEDVKREIKSLGLDVPSLYNERVIDDKIYDLCKDPDLGLMKPPPEGGNALSNPAQFTNLIVKYHNIKQHFNAALNKNKDEIDHSLHKINENPRPKTVVPIPFKHQIDRPPIIKPTEYSRGETSIIEEGGESEVNTSSSFYKDPLRKTHHFDSYPVRKLPFPYQHMKIHFYEMEKYVNVKPKREAYIDFDRSNKKVKSAFDTNHLTNSLADKSDLNELFFRTQEHHVAAFYLDKITSRENHFMKRGMQRASPDIVPEKINHTSTNFYQNDNGSFIRPFRA
jgi:hypothetical protein